MQMQEIFWQILQTEMPGDALNAIELGIMTTERSSDGKIHITREVAQECIQEENCQV